MKSRIMSILSVVLLISAMSAQAIPMVFTTTLSGPNESPPNGSPGTGTATITLDDVALNMRVQADFSGLTGNTVAAHIHCCELTPLGTAAVATTTPTFPNFPAGVTSGSYDQLFNMTDPASYNSSFLTAAGGVPQMAFTNLLNGFNAGFAYFNIHTTTFGGGEIRGFLEPAPTGVPVPGTLLLILAALGCMVRPGRLSAAS